MITIMQNPRQYKIPDWFLNRQKDIKDGKYSQVWKFKLFSDVYEPDFSSDSFFTNIVIYVLDTCQQS